MGGIFGSETSSKFYRKDEALPAEKLYYGGTPPEMIKLGTVFSGANIQLIDKTTELVPGITLIALVSTLPGLIDRMKVKVERTTIDGVRAIIVTPDSILPNRQTGVEATLQGDSDIEAMAPSKLPRRRPNCINTSA